MVSVRPLAAACSAMSVLGVAGMLSPWSGSDALFVVSLTLFGVLGPLVVALRGVSSPRGVLALMVPALLIGAIVGGAEVIEAPFRMPVIAAAVCSFVLVVLTTLVQADDTSARRGDPFR